MMIESLRYIGHTTYVSIEKLIWRILAMLGIAADVSGFGEDYSIA